MKKFICHRHTATRQKLLGFLLLLCFAIGAQAQKIRIKTGIEVLKSQNFRCLEGKRVGLITNPTGVDNELRSTIDILHEAPNVNLVALYGPEHGVRGDVHAGDHVSDQRDPATGLPVYSLYGKTRKATPEMLKDVRSPTSVPWDWPWRQLPKTARNSSCWTAPIRWADSR